MVEETNKFIRIDLNQFKLHLYLKPEAELTLHFDSPSRRFYLSVIGLVVYEMKRRGKITSILLQEHLDVLALLNKTVGGSAGSSKKEHLLPRIYRKWKDALPDLENAPLFKVVGRKKRYDELMDKVYGFSEGEKDSWANLFEYKGSHEHVRLRFSIGRLEASLDEVIIVYGEDPQLENVDAWEGFIARLEENLEDKSEPESADFAFKASGQKLPWLSRWRALPSRWQRTALCVAIGIIVGAAAFGVWKYNFFAPPVEVASEENMAFPLPEKPSIAVLPFRNLSDDPKQDYFSDGLTEEIITALSKIDSMFVIAHNSTSTFKGKPVKIKQVAEEMGVRYVLEGSVRKAGDRVRITAQLIDAFKGYHLWAERYDRDLKDIFFIQDDITKNIIMALQMKLSGSLYLPESTDSLEAYLKLLQAKELWGGDIRKNIVSIRQLAEEAVALDPNYAWAYESLGATHLNDIYYGLTKDMEKSWKTAFELGQKAQALDEKAGHDLLGSLYQLNGQHEKAVAEAERYVEIVPNFAWAQSNMGRYLMNADRLEEALPFFKRGLRLDPYAMAPFYYNLGCAYWMMGQYEEAISICKVGLNRHPDDMFTHMVLAVSYIETGRGEEARASATEVLRIYPKVTLEWLVKMLPWKNKDQVNRWTDDLRKAGIPDKPPLPRPDKPSIAVLPFANMSEDPKQEYFSDGITEEIITALSKTPKLFVIARNSTFTYKGKPVKVQEVAEQLGVRYVLDGSVRRVGGKVRITAQLADAASGHLLWAESYDRKLEDIFSVQDEITKKIITALQVKLTEGERAQVYAKGTDNLEAYLKILQVISHLRDPKPENNVLARQLTEEAIAIDPNWPMTYSILGWTHVFDVFYGTSKTPAKSLERASELGQKALALDEKLGAAHHLLSVTYTLKKQFEKAIEQGKLSLEFNPNMADFQSSLARLLMNAGRPEESIPLYKKAIRLNPYAHGAYYYNFGYALWMIGKYEEALAAGKQAQSRSPNDMFSHMLLAVAYIELGRDEEASASAAEVVRIKPDLTLEWLTKMVPWKNKADVDRLIEDLRRAGLN